MNLPRATGAMLILLGLALHCGCGGGGGAALVGLQVAPTEFTARVGDAVQLAVIATLSNGTQADQTARVTWKSTVPAVGEVRDVGVFAATGVGQTEVAASRGAVTSNRATYEVVAVPALPTAAYLPLGLGFRWEYTGSDVSPAQVASSQQDPITLIQSIQHQVVRDISVWYDVLIKGTDPLEPPGHIYLRHDPAGLVISEIEGAPPLILLPSSLTAGAAWDHPEDPDRSFVLASVSEHVEVPAGTFENCLKVVETDTFFDPTARIIVWFARDAGIVWEQVYQGDTLLREQKLVTVDFGFL